MKLSTLLIIVTVIIFPLSFWLTYSYAPNETEYLTLLENEGLSNIQLTGWAYIGCGKDDQFRETFNASRTIPEPNGTFRTVKVNGIICSGVYKGSTIRYFR